MATSIYDKDAPAPSSGAKSIPNDKALAKSLSKDYVPPTPPALPEPKPNSKDNMKMVPMKKGGKVSASTRADGIAQRGKTRGKMC